VTTISCIFEPRRGIDAHAAMFAGGTVLGVRNESAADAAHASAEVFTETLELGATFAFGMMLTPEVLTKNGVLAWVFAAACLVVARPLALAASLVGSELRGHEIAVAGWFGPRGFASILFALVVLGSHVPRAFDLFDIIAVTTALSIVVHSSTDSLVARAYRERPRPQPAHAS
jgi:NhaP-type Na+/H+ or K+/H+ antiporter